MARFRLLLTETSISRSQRADVGEGKSRANATRGPKPKAFVCRGGGLLDASPALLLSRARARASTTRGDPRLELPQRGVTLPLVDEHASTFEHRAVDSHHESWHEKKRRQKRQGWVTFMGWENKKFDLRATLGGPGGGPRPCAAPPRATRCALPRGRKHLPRSHLDREGTGGASGALRVEREQIL